MTLTKKLQILFAKVPLFSNTLLTLSHIIKPHVNEFQLLTTNIQIKVITHIQHKVLGLFPL